MLKRLKFFSTYYQCPSCWIQFIDTKSRYFPQGHDTLYDKKCYFCEKNPSPLDVIRRQIALLPDLQYSDVSNMAYFIQNLVKHIELKE